MENIKIKLDHVIRVSIISVMAYSKLFSSIVHSSLWTEEHHVRLLFVTLLALADREGHVYGSRNGLERAANILYSVEDGDIDPWESLMAPDPDSADLIRNPENEGRRIEAIDGGFRILNYVYYRSLRNDDDRREQNREAQQRFRDKSRSTRVKREISERKPRSASISPDKPISEAEAEAYSRGRRQSTSPKGDVGASGSPPTSKLVKSNGLLDSEWIATLGRDETYRGINISEQLGKMTRWCEVNRKTPTRRRFINWLNRADKPLARSKPPKPTLQKPIEPLPEWTPEQIAENKRKIAELKRSVFTNNATGEI